MKLIFGFLTILENYLLPKEDEDDEEDCPFPTLEEAAEMIKDNKQKTNNNKTADETNAEVKF